MSGREISGKPVVAAAGCAVLGAMALIAYVAFGEMKSPSAAAMDAAGPGCIALAIDRETGTTSAVPCGKTQMLLAEQAGPSK